jgi:hypothetical protein
MHWVQQIWNDGITELTIEWDFVRKTQNIVRETQCEEPEDKTEVKETAAAQS